MKNLCQGELKIAPTSPCFTWGILLDSVLTLSTVGDEAPYIHPVRLERKLEDEGCIWSDGITKRQMSIQLAPLDDSQINHLFSTLFPFYALSGL